MVTFLRCGSHPASGHPEHQLCWQFGRDEQGLPGGVRALSQQWAALLSHPSPSQASTSDGPWEQERLPFLALLLPCCISSLPCLLRASDSPINHELQWAPRHLRWLWGTVELLQALAGDSPFGSSRS